VKERLVSLAEQVRKAVLPYLSRPSRKVARHNGGDPHFAVDEVAEEAVRAVLETWDIPLAYLSEDRGLVRLAERPEYLLIIDPIDGTRPAMGCMESCCFSVAVLPYAERPVWKHVTHALVSELKSGDVFYAEASRPGVECSGPLPPALSENTSLDSMFWSLELTAHPVERLVSVYGHLVDGSVARGAVFVFTSSSYSLTRIVTGQLDSHVDIGHRLLCDRPELLPEFLHVGRGKPVTLFPYDIAAAAFIAQKAGAIVTDAHGRPLDELPLLTDKSLSGQCSLIAAANRELHDQIMHSLRW
jgi:myo-inositol-1(or 4)-monophosphatase